MTEPAAPENFDPYHKWLGISPKDQPPHHYRLLAIDLFESDPDVISAAADKQMAFIRSFQTGKYTQFSQKILNEIASARICLLSAAKKAAYDDALRARLAAAAAASGIKRAKPLPAVAVAIEDEAVVVAELADLDFSGPQSLQLGGGGSSQIGKSKSKKVTIMPLLALAAMLAVCGIVIAVVMSRPPQTHESQVAEDRSGGPSGDAQPAGVKPATQDQKPPLPANSAKPASTKDSARPTGPGDNADVTSPTKPPQVADLDGASGNKSNGKPPATPDRKPGGGDDPFDVTPVSVPEAETLAKPAEPAKAEKPKSLEELEKQLADAKTPEDYQAMADEALRAASQAIDDNQPDAAKKLILKALIAARKSADSKLIVKVTRALTRPETVKEILAEKDEQDKDPGRDPAPPRNSSPRSANQTPVPAGQQGLAILVPKRVGLHGTDKLGLLIGPVRQGTQITLQYDGGTWTNPLTQQSINPDDASHGIYSVAIATRGANPRIIRVLPTGTAEQAFHWRANQDYESLVLRCSIAGIGDRLGGRVYYRMTVHPPGQ
jgi:hypothetical protein